MFLSIDFEDFSHDLKRDLGIWKTGTLRVDCLWESYYEIDSFLKKVGGTKGQKATFFCTGIIAKQAPDLLRAIAEDGHEIASHYYFHDEMYKQDLSIIDKNLKKSKELLEDASSSPVIGFRAPKFKIDKREVQQYSKVQESFIYDSSFVARRTSDVELFTKSMSLEKLKILPIFTDKINGINLKLGGSYLKIFPAQMSKKLIINAEGAGFTPHIYIHPYEFNSNQSYRVRLKELSLLNIPKSIYWSLRQHQWLSIGNYSLQRKLAFLIGDKGLGGRLCDHLL